MSKVHVEIDYSILLEIIRSNGFVAGTLKGLRITEKEDYKVKAMTEAIACLEKDYEILRDLKIIGSA